MIVGCIEKVSDNETEIDDPFWFSVFTIWKLTCMCSVLSFQKKGNSIKTIPAFKPIPADNATPDSTPEKGSPPREKEKKSKDKDRKSGKGSNISTGVPGNVGQFGSSASSAVSDGTSCGSGKGESNGSSSGKFTTANFTETVITHGSSVFGGGEKSKKVKKMTAKNMAQQAAGQSEAESGEDANANASSDTGSDGSCKGGSGDGTAEGESTGGFAQRASGNLVPSAIPPGQQGCPNGAVVPGAASYSSVYESFLSGNYSAGVGKGDGSVKRQKSQGSSDKERKKHKKNGSSR